jgi:uncharacterized protein (DUF1697 family)
MPVVISLLRGVNVVGRNQIKMAELRDLYESLGLLEVQTHLQSGNVVFRTKAKDLAKLAKQTEDAIERRFGFRPSVILRTTSELRDVVARNPFTKRADIDGSKFLVTFLATAPRPEVHAELVKVKTAGEEVHLGGCELYIYFSDGMGRSKLWRAIERTLKKSGTGRNWNTVTRLLEMAEKLEGARRHA